MHVPVNMLLRAEDMRLAPAAAKAIFAALRNASPDAVTKTRRGLIDPADIVRNARLTDDQTLRLIYDRCGEVGLFALFVLTGSEPPQYFEWVLTRITQKSIFIGSDKLQDSVLSPDNDHQKFQVNWKSKRCHREKPDVSRYNTNVLMPWLSHELYLPGVRSGFLVHGMGGSRILVSHPFFDSSNESYGVLNYAPRIDRHLVSLGINGALLYFDLMPGLDYPLAGDDAWLGWFSLVASHSDAVIFIERTSTGLTCGQLREAAVISDRVPMKIVPMTDDQLGHVGGEHPKGEVHRIVPGEGFVTKKRMDEIESASTREHLNRYIDRGAYRADRMHVVDQSGRTRQYPLDHPMYGHLPLITDTNAQFGPPRLPAELDFLRFLMPDLFNG